ncbi:MAG TPA: TIGR02594 family protein, partial [Longimicrobium sp.]
EEGDPERPCVIGSVWSGKDRVPGPLHIVTRGGNTLRLSDEPGKEAAEIHTARGTCLIQLDNDAGGVPTITLHAEGDLALEATGEIRMRCRRLVQRVEEDATRDVGGGEAVKIGGGLKLATGRELALSAGTDASLHAAASLETLAGATHSIAGALVQIQPPGHVRRAVQVVTPAPKAALSHARPVPTPVRGTSTSDARTPRAGERRPAHNATRPPPPFRVTRVTAQGPGNERGTSIRARTHTTVVLTADRFTRPPAEGELQQIRWGVRIGSGPVEPQGARGEQLTLRLEEKHDGRQIRVYAFCESASEQVCAAIQVGESREWMPFAERELNVTEIRQPGRHNPRILEYHRTTTLSRGDAGNDETPWCSSFVNWVMTRAGYRGTNNALAVSWLRWGHALEEPRRGAIMVVRRKSSGGDRATGSSTGNHVGFFVRATATHFTLLGGNQGGGWRVTESDYRRESYHILGCRWPD